MTAIVADASVFGPIFLDDKEADILPGLIDAFVSGAVVVPTHWRLEVASLLQSATKRERIDRPGFERARSLVEATPVTIDRDTGHRALDRTWVLAERHGLTIYDAAYLELAERLGHPLASLDRALLRAADAVALPIFGR